MAAYDVAVIGSGSCDLAWTEASGGIAISRSTVASSHQTKPYGKRSSKNASNTENEFVLVHGEVNFRKKIHAKQYVKIFRLERKQGNFNFLAS